MKRLVQVKDAHFESFMEKVDRLLKDPDARLVNVESRTIYEHNHIAWFEIDYTIKPLPEPVSPFNMNWNIPK